MSSDALETFLEVGDQGFEDPEKMFNLGTSFNTGTLQPMCIDRPHPWGCMLDLLLSSVA